METKNNCHSYQGNIMPIDDLAMAGAQASAAMISTILKEIFSGVVQY